MYVHCIHKKFHVSRTIHSWMKPHTFFMSTSYTEPITCRAPSFLRQSLCSGGVWRMEVQNASTGSSTPFRLVQAWVRKCWAAISGDTRSSNTSGEGGNRGGNMGNTLVPNRNTAMQLHSLYHYSWYDMVMFLGTVTALGVLCCFALLFV